MPLDHYILGGKDGREAIPVSMDDWAKWYDLTERHVGATDIRAPNRLLWWLGLRPDWWVSTVFLGIDHQYRASGPPLIFETMVFPRWPWWKAQLANPGGRWFFEKSPPWYLRPLYRKSTLGHMTSWFPRLSDWSESREYDMARYSTWKQAEEGHRKMVATWTLIARGLKERENV